jgi:hypothetical protein
MDVSRRARKVTRVMLPSRIASLRPFRGWVVITVFGGVCVPGSDLGVDGIE